MYYVECTSCTSHVFIVPRRSCWDTFILIYMILKTAETIAINDLWKEHLMNRVNNKHVSDVVHVLTVVGIFSSSVWYYVNYLKKYVSAG